MAVATDTSERGIEGRICTVLRECDVPAAAGLADEGDDEEAMVAVNLADGGDDDLRNVDGLA